MPSFQDLHLTPGLAAALEGLGWDANDPLARDTAPTAARGHNLVAATPPVPAYAAPALAGILTRLGSGSRGLLLSSESQLDEWGRVAHRIAQGSGIRVQVAHGAARAMRRLKADAVDLVIATPETALTLLGRSALQPEAIAAVFLAWPESWGDEESITPLMQDLPRETQRIIYTAAPDRVEALVERYARKAMTSKAPGLESGTQTARFVPWGFRGPDGSPRWRSWWSCSTRAPSRSGPRTGATMMRSPRR